MSNEFVVPLPPRISQAADVEMLLEHMVKLGGSDLFLLGGAHAWISLYGKKVRITARQISDTEVKSLLSAIYNANAPALLGAGDQINAAYEFYRDVSESDFAGRLRYRFRINAVGCIRNGRPSMTVTMRTIPSDPPHWEDLGIEKEIIEVVRNLDQGLVMVVGATGQGKSTVLASILRDRIERESSHTNLVTIEHPVEFVYDGIKTSDAFCTQIQVGKDVKTFQEGVENSLRMAPDVILVGETRDFETAQASLQASISGHGVLSTAHVNTSAETFQRLMYVYPQEMQQQARVDIVQPMRMIVAQRLVKTLDGKRKAMREILILDQDDRENLMTASNISTAAFQLLERKGKPMIESALALFNDRLISEEEFRRVEMNYKALKKEASYG